VNGARIHIASESFSLERGGAARVGRLTAGVARDARWSARLLALSDPTPVGDFQLPSTTAAGSRWKFVFECWRSVLNRSHFIYNHPGIARAHLRSPLFRRPFAVWMLGYDAWSERMRGDYGKIIVSADQLISISSYTRARAAEIVPRAHEAEICWLGTEEDEAAPWAQEAKAPPTVLILSRIDRSEMQKGHLELIEAWPTVRVAVPDARLLIAGGGNGLEILRSMAAASSAACGIRFTDSLTQAQANALWSKVHVFAMPSRQEGFGIVYIEAMRHGLPVIASIHDAGQEVNVDEVTGFNVNLDRPGELAERIILLLRDADLARRIGKAGLARWREHFAWSAFRKRLEPILAEFLHL
jgi:phosphatidylinositol alpha-1,6-mannosyltransferase